MVDRDKTEGLLRRLREYTGYLRETAAQDAQDFLSDPRSIGSTRYYLQVAIETCINIANHLIATEGLRAPRDYKDSFRAMNEAGIIPDGFAATMQELAGLRNLLVHVYWDVDDQLIHSEVRTNLRDFETFAAYILDYLETHSA